MDEKINEQQASANPQRPPLLQPQLCSMGCGFFSSAQYDGMCSKCFSVVANRTASTTTNPTSTTTNQNTGTVSVTPSSKDSDSLSETKAIITGFSPQHATADEVSLLGEDHQQIGKRDDDLCASSIPLDESPATTLINSASSSPAKNASPPPQSGTMIQPQQQKNQSSPTLQKNLTAAAAATENATANDVTNSSSSEVAKVATNLESTTAAIPPPEKKPSNRCAACRKRVGLTGFSCRCGDVFCSAHRYSDTHDCKFDYRGTAAEQIRMANPQVLPQKLHKI